MSAIEIKLQHSVQFGEQTIDVLRLRRPKAKDFRSLKNMDMPFAMMLDFAAELADLPPAALDNLDVDDVPRVMEVVSGFLGGFPGTGKM